MVWLESHGIQHWEKVQHLGRNNPIHQCRLGADWLGRSSAKRDLGVLVDKWGMNQECAGLGRCCQQVKGSVPSPLLSAGRHIQSTGFHFRLPCTGKNGHAGVSQPTNHQKRWYREHGAKLFLAVQWTGLHQGTMDTRWNWRNYH